MIQKRHCASTLATARAESNAPAGEIQKRVPQHRLENRPLPARPAAEAVRGLDAGRPNPRFDPCRLVRQVKQFGGYAAENSFTCRTSRQGSMGSAGVRG